MLLLHSVCQSMSINMFAITAIGLDRPGIVAAVTEALFRLDCNIEDSQMTILRGHFAMVLVISAPAKTGEGDLERELEPVREGLDLEAVVARRVHDAPAQRQSADHVLTVYGADHPGIVAAVTRALADLEVNITDLNTRLAGDPKNPLYAMMLELTLPEGVSEQRLQEALEDVGRSAEVEVSLRPLAADSL